MPKIIKNIKPKIICVAKNIFLDEGIESVDIRRIAKEVGIATGTVYNYFPKKTDILTAVLDDMWEKSIIMLDQLIENTDENLLEQYIGTFFMEMDKKNNLGVYLFKLKWSEKKKSEINYGEELFVMNSAVYIKQQIERMLVKHFKLNISEEDKINKFDKLLNSSMLLLLSAGAYDRDIQFISVLIKSYIENIIE